MSSSRSPFFARRSAPETPRPERWPARHFHDPGRIRACPLLVPVRPCHHLAVRRPNRKEDTMLTTTIRRIVFSALVAVSAPLAAGCYAEAEAPGTYDGYTPIYHDGYVVYYDRGGAPYYYNGGRQVYVERGAYYDRYAAHYRTYGPRYNSWYQNRGYRYHGYRNRR
jgi:hypothetical protein